MGISQPQKSSTSWNSVPAWQTSEDERNFWGTGKNVWHACLQTCHIMWRFFCFFSGWRVQTSTAWSAVASWWNNIFEKNHHVTMWKIQNLSFMCVNYVSMFNFVNSCCLLCNDWVVDIWMTVHMIKFCVRRLYWSRRNAYFLITFPLAADIVVQ